MTGSPAERNLLGAIILDSKQHAYVRKIVGADDFEDARMGVVFDQVGIRASQGLPVDAAIVNGLLPEWGVRGLHVEPFMWADADVYVHAAPEYADSVRAASAARSVRSLMQVAHTELTDGVGPLDVATNALNRLQKLVDGSTTGDLITKTLGELLEGSDDYDWVIPNTLERRDRIVFTGPEGSGKTTLARQIALLSAAGIHPFEFYAIPPVGVLVVDAENTEMQWRREVRLVAERAAARPGAVDPSKTINITTGQRIDITKGPHLAAIHRLIDRHKPDVLFIGPLYKLVPGAINSDEEAAPLIVALDSLRDRGVALVMEAHAGKAAGPNGDRDLRPRGSSALLGWPEFGYGLQPVQGRPGAVEMRPWRGGRDRKREWPRELVRGQLWPWEQQKHQTGQEVPDRTEQQR
jgi:energy-coupling factor transporter ATP-binding protein EcfA2